MTEFMHIDAEMGFVTFDELLDLLGGLLISVVNDVWENCEPYLKTWNATRPVLGDKVPCMKMEDIHELYEKETKDKVVDKRISLLQKKSGSVSTQRRSLAVKRSL